MNTKRLTPWFGAQLLPARSGWYNASTARDANARRWFNALLNSWSAPCYVGDPDDVAERAKTTPADTVGLPIEWRGVLK